MSRHAGLSLSPPNVTAVEGASSLVSAAHRDAIPWDDLARAFDPETCPARLLPWLATVFSVDVWFDEWSESQKRAVIARAIELHQIKGTLAGIEAYASLVGARVVEARVPPDVFFLDEDDGRGRAAWLASLPAIEIRHWRRSGQGEQAGALCDRIYPGEAIETGAGTIAHEQTLDDDEPDILLPAFFALDGPERALSGMDAILIEDGVETPLAVESGFEAGDRRGVIADVERVYFPAPADPYLFLALDNGAPSDDPTFLGDNASTGYAAFVGTDERRYAVWIRRSLSRASSTPAAAVRGRELADVDPERFYPTEPAPETLFLGEVPWDPAVLGYLADELTIWTAFVDRWRLLDPDKPASVGPAFSYLGVDRLGMPPYEAEITVEMPEPSNPLALFLNDVPGDAGDLGFLLEEKAEALWRLCSVLNAARSKRDRVLVGVARRGSKSLRDMNSLAELFS